MLPVGTFDGNYYEVGALNQERLFYCAYVRNHVKLLHVYKSRRVSPRALYCVVDSSYGLCRSLGHCRPALPKGWKYQMVKTQTQSHVRRPVVWTDGRSGVSFPLIFSGGRLDFVTQAFGDSPKLSSIGLANQWLIRRSEFIASYKKYFY